MFPNNGIDYIHMEHRSYKFRLYPTEEQKTLMLKTFGCVRFVWNRMIAEATPMAMAGAKENRSWIEGWLLGYLLSDSPL